MRFVLHDEDQGDTYPDPCERHFICNFFGLLQKYRELLAAKFKGTQQTSQVADGGLKHALLINVSKTK